MRLDAVVARPVKRAADVARRVGLDAVDGLVNDAQADLDSGGGRPVGVAREDRVRSGVARLVLLLVRDDFEVEELAARRHVDALAALEHLAVFHVSDAEIDVRNEPLFDLHVDHHGAARVVNRRWLITDAISVVTSRCALSVGSIASTCAVSPG